MHIGNCRIVALDYLRDCTFECAGVVRMGQHIAVVNHVNSNLPVAEYLGCKRFLDHAAWGHGFNGRPLMLEIVLERLPRKFENAFKALDGPFLFQFGQIVESTRHRLRQSCDRAIEILKPLYPSNIRHSRLQCDRVCGSTALLNRLERSFRRQCDVVNIQGSGFRGVRDEAEPIEPGETGASAGQGERARFVAIDRYREVI